MSCGESSGPHGIGSAARMTAVRRYEASMYDSNRWDGFELRPGDIIISTPPKCGTTWTQMICALLILQEPELPLSLDTLSPWVDDETPSTQVGSSLRRTVEHLQTFRDAADDLDVVYLHYDDLKAGLEGQMRQMAARLGIDVDEHRWPRLVQAATFESMRSRADTTVPGGGPEHWIDPAAFFSRGTSGQWRDLLDDADLARYAARVRALASDNLVEWVHREPID